MSVLQSAKARLKVMEEEWKALQWEHEVLEQRFEKVRSVSLFILPTYPVSGPAHTGFSHHLFP